MPGLDRSFWITHALLPLALFVVLALRAWWVPRLGWTPKQIGIAEIAGTTAVALVSLFTV